LLLRRFKSFAKQHQHHPSFKLDKVNLFPKLNASLFRSPFAQKLVFKFKNCLIILLKTVTNSVFFVFAGLYVFVVRADLSLIRKFRLSVKLNRVR
jgi:hypothetical protein